MIKARHEWFARINLNMQEKNRCWIRLLNALDHLGYKMLMLNKYKSNCQVITTINGAITENKWRENWAKAILQYINSI